MRRLSRQTGSNGRNAGLRQQVQGELEAMAATIPRVIIRRGDDIDPGYGKRLDHLRLRLEHHPVCNGPAAIREWRFQIYERNVRRRKQASDAPHWPGWVSLLACHGCNVTRQHHVATKQKASHWRQSTQLETAFDPEWHQAQRRSQQKTASRGCQSKSLAAAL